MNNLVNEVTESPSRSSHDFGPVFIPAFESNSRVIPSQSPPTLPQSSSCATACSGSSSSLSTDTEVDDQQHIQSQDNNCPNQAHHSNFRNLYLDLDLANDLRSRELSSGTADFPGATLHQRGLSAASAQTSATRYSKKRSKRFSVNPRPLSQVPNENPSLRDEKGFSIAPESQNSNIIGEEPGIDVDTMNVDLLDSPGSQVTIIDYSPENCQIAHYDVEKDGNSIITGSSDRKMLRCHLNEALYCRPAWSRVRWVVVNGLSWEALQPIAIKYKLHPLAVEDMLDVPQRTKLEVFPGQLFCCFPLHVLSTTPTPYTLLSLCMRHSLLLVVKFFTFLFHCFKTLWSSCMSTFLRCVGQNKIGNSDAENNTRTSLPSPPTYFSTNDRESRFSTDRDSFGKLKPGTPSSYLAKKSYFEVVDKLSRFSSRSSHNNASEVTLCEQLQLPTEVCIPFYTLSRGMLCGDAESSPVARRIREMASRSMYDWNQGNVALKREAAQNMHISGSANSIEIALEQVSLFLIDDTVISVFEKSAPEIYRPLENRLRSPDTLLRNTSDPAILVQAVLDASVDLLGPILNEYRSRLNKLQVQSIRLPNLQHTRALHAFITDLTVLRPPLRSLVSIVEQLWSKSVINRGSSGLCDLDSEETSYEDVSKKDQDHFDKKQRADRAERPHLQPHEKRQGSNSGRFAADAASFYFRNVVDHSLMYLQDLDDMRNQSKTLSSLIFNTISIRASDSVKMLSLVSVVFLPLTFLTGYFGMNFKGFAMLDHDVNYYWIVATPAAVALTVIVMYPTMISQCQELWSWAREMI